MFKKLGELFELSPAAIQPATSILCDARINEIFEKFAGELKRIAPKADDFLYFSAVMMHAAESSLINSDGTVKIGNYGKPVEAHWEKKGESWRWAASDPTVRPYKNANGDIFPEEELLKAYKQWVGKPLCVDHKSNSVDAIRGVIIDTYYDRMLKRVIALCALDKVSYPELARKVATGTSTSVSMGTGVGKAICSDCGNVARIEKDFCVHMRTKSCYGEINCDLQPIELSIVVNGADPQAKIRTILAAADELNTRLYNTEREIEKLSNHQGLDKIKSLEEDLKKVSDTLASLKSDIESEDKSTNSVDAPYGVTSGTYDESSLELSNDQGLNVPQRFAASTDAVLDELGNIKASVEEKFDNMKKSLEILSNKLHTIKEEIMSAKDANMNKEAYFQGGGEGNEPTPGKPRYEKDPLNEKLRSEDKHMVGQSPFPEVGSVDGMHPSPGSAEPKDELERKKMLARAEEEERSIRRAAALQKAKENLMNHKEAYFQGGGEGNEPAPHKVKYPIDKLNEQLRDREDKQMVGQKPFPDVGDVEGMHPSPASADVKDELKRKQLLQRATLKARFVKSAKTDGTDDLANSAWNVYLDDKLVLTASIDEISGGRTEVLYDTIATKEFGTKMLEKIRSVGFDKAAGLYKKAQAVSGMGAQPAAPADMGGAAPVPPMADPGAAPAEAPLSDVGGEDAGGKGDPKETATALVDEVSTKVSDLKEVIKELTGEQAEMSDMQEMSGKAASTLAPFVKMRKELNAALIAGMKKSVAELKEHESELSLIAGILEDEATLNGENKEHIESVIEDAITDAKAALVDADKLKEAFGKYTRGTDGLRKRADEEKAMLDANDVKDESSEACADDADADDLNFNLHMGEGPHSEHDEEDRGFNKELDGALEEGEESLFDKQDEDQETEDILNDANPVDDQNDIMMEVPPGAVVKPASREDNLTTKEGRAAYRAKLAAQSVQFSDMLDQADKLADGQTQLDVKPSDDLGRVETLEEQHKKVLEVAEMAPKVRKEAERLNQLISEGKVSSSDLDSLVSQGLDPEVVKYWRQYYGEAGKEGSEFGKLLTQESVNSKVAEEVSTYKVKIARAYEFANEMVRRGLLADERNAVSEQVNEIMTWNDEAFDSMKRVVAKSPLASMRKEASGLPQVGQMGSGDTFTQNATESDLQSELSKAFSGKRY